LFDTVLG